MLQRQQEYLEQQTALEEQQAKEKEKQEQDRIDQIKNKTKDEQSECQRAHPHTPHNNTYLLGHMWSCQGKPYRTSRDVADLTVVKD